MKFFLLAFPALLSIINPLGGAFVFLGATQRLGPEMRAHLARWVAIHSFFILNASLWVGAYVLSFLGISMPVLRVAGGIVIALAGWRMLNAKDESEQRDNAIELASSRDASRIAFFPLTMPITAGPGTISVAIALGTSRPRGADHLFWFFLAATFTTILICAVIYVLYRYSSRLATLIGPTGTVIVLRLTAFLLFCIGIQVLWTGVSDLLEEVLRR
ncbi:MAG TPA: MarC family protein [Burkholderiales bacterium]|nr:MarC family protein [Burkholderiales bacterium]